MEPFVHLSGGVVPVDRANVDTDALIPKQFMKSIRRTGFGDNLFDEWRFMDPGVPGKPLSQRTPNLDFALNQPAYAGAQIVLTRENFGCGSSREHAVWALRDFGIRALIAPSFADIFRGNCVKNGLLPVVLTEASVQSLFDLVASAPGLALSIDLPSQTVGLANGKALGFEISAFAKHCLLNGLDEISLTLEQAARVREYETTRRAVEPWLFGDIPQA